MTILCGTDFSEASERALGVAARLAVRLQTRLHLVHADHYGSREQNAVSQHVAFATQLERTADRARALGAVVRTHSESGPPDEALLAIAKRTEVKLIVVGALGTRAAGAWQLGSHAERLAQTSHVPVLVVRDDDPFASWLSGKRPLRVLLGADFSQSTDAAARVVRGWRALSPCDVNAVHLYWPPQEFARLGLSGVRSYLDPDPEVTKTLVRDLTHRLEADSDSNPIEVHVEPHLGRLGDRLAELAGRFESDLLVVGSHPRGALARVREGSVSHWALHAARTSVLCVPAPAKVGATQVPRMRNVVAATDFSPAGNAAVATAYALAELGGTVHLVHVVPPNNTDPLVAHDVFDLEHGGKPDPGRERVHAALAELVPADAGSRMTRYYALQSDDLGAAICQAAGRLDADAICLGKRGRSNLAQVLLGSTSQHVLANAQCPVLLEQAPRI
jgi:nucleotide-binding universal stress UspA family protein